MTEADIDEYRDFSTLTVIPEWEIKAWSPDEESINPWVAVENGLEQPNYLTTWTKGKRTGLVATT